MSRESPVRRARRQVCVSYLFAALFATNQAPPFHIFSKYPGTYLSPRYSGTTWLETLLSNELRANTLHSHSTHLQALKSHNQ